MTDAAFMQHEFAPTFSEQDLVNIEAWHVYIKTQVKGEPVPPFSMYTKPNFEAWNAMRRPDIAQAIKELSRLTYGRDVAEVEVDISRRAKL